MRRCVVLIAVVGLLGAAAAPAAATGTSSKPRISILNFHKSGTPGPEGEQEWILTVEARDLDGVIWEIEVLWGDHSVTWATTACVQGPEIGRKATLRIGHSYAAPGTYRLRVRAMSIPSCGAGFDEHQHSRWEPLVVHPRP